MTKPNERPLRERLAAIRGDGSDPTKAMHATVFAQANRNGLIREEREAEQRETEQRGLLLTLFEGHLPDVPELDEYERLKREDGTAAVFYYRRNARKIEQQFDVRTEAIAQLDAIVEAHQQAERTRAAQPVPAAAPPTLEQQLRDGFQAELEGKGDPPEAA